jgi:hypothetical protein
LLALGIGIDRGLGLVEVDARFVLMPMPAEFVKGIAEPMVTYAVREGPSAAAPSAEEAGDK